MLTNKEIRAIPVPVVTEEIANAISSGDNRRYCITCEKKDELLILNLFGRNESGEIKALYRSFLEKTDCRTENFINKKISNATLGGVLSRTYYGELCALTGEEMINIKTTLCSVMSCDTKNFEKYSLYSLLWQYAERIYSIRADIRFKKKRDMIDTLMAKEKPLPKDFDKTVERAIKDAHYGWYNKKAKTCTCSNCLSTFKLSNPKEIKEADKGICPSCKITFEYCPSGRRTYRTKTRMAVFIQAVGYHQLLVRYITLRLSYKEYKTVVDMAELIRTHINFDEKPNVRDYEWYWIRGENSPFGWRKPVPSMFSPEGFHYGFFPGVIHANGLTSEFRKAGLDKELKNFFENSKTLVKLSNYRNSSVYKDVRYLEILAKYPCVERLMSVGLSKIASTYFIDSPYRKEIFNPKATSLKKMFNVSSERFKEIVEYNPRYEELEYLHMASDKKGCRRSFSDIMEVGSTFGSRAGEVLQLTHSEEVKLRIYLSSNSIFYGDYFDYKNNMSRLGANMKSELVLYPKNFKKAHDNSVVELKTRRKEKEIAALNKILPSLHKIYDYIDPNEDYIIIAPADGKEIINEGDALNHCVGEYIDKVVAKTSVILFLRKKDTPEKPFVTMEINPKSRKLVQARGFDNEDPGKTVWKFIEKFKAEKHIA